MPRAISPGPVGLKFWRAPGLSADNTADINNLPAGIGNQFNPWGPKRPVQDWVWGNLCLYPPSLAVTFPADAGSYALTGSDLGLIPGDIANLPAGGANWFNPWGRKRPVQDWFKGPIPAVPVIFTADGSSYTLTGAAVASAIGQVAGSGSYTLIGSAATWALGHAAASGSYTLTGTAAAMAFGHAAGAGSYSITGSAAALALVQVAGAGSYTLTGTSAGVAITIATGAGSYTSTGSAVTFAFGQGAAAGSYTLTGTDAVLVIPGAVTYLPAGMSGGYVPWGRPFPVTLLSRSGRPLAEADASVTLTAAGGSYTITGSAAALTVASPPDTTNLPAGAVNWFNPWRRPYPVSLRTSSGRPLEVGPITLTAAAGSYTLTGSSAALALQLTANSGTYTVSGTAAVLARGFAAGAGAYAITGTDANLVQAGSITLVCGAGSYTITGGADVTFIGITPPTVEQPGGGYTGRVSGASRGRMIRRRKRGELDLPPDLEPPPLGPSPPDLPPPAPGPRPPDLLPPQPGLMTDMAMPQPKPLPPHVDEDEDEIALLLEILNRS